ncbi:MAG: exodeoxyribonuclease VII large subunit [Roseburia sp.]
MTKNIYGVYQINQYIKNMFAQDFMLRNICIKGEVSNCKYHSSGHIYFRLKENGSAMDAVMFVKDRKGLKFSMQDGDQVQVTGSIQVYDRDGRYQLYAKEIELAGAGDLYQRFEQLKRELEEMGMFAPEYKKPIPGYATRVGVVTAPTGAAIQDIRNISSRRNPYVQVILYPALVQGDGAVASIVNGIRALDAMHLDVIIVGRGGGSIEDLWAFNEEAVARAIFECETPVISAVGHETDTTIADYVADLRAPTPSAAAELAIFDWNQFQEKLASYGERFHREMENLIKIKRGKYQTLSARLQQLSPRNQLNAKMQYAGELQFRLESAMRDILEKRKARFALLAQRMEDLSPLKKLGHGFVYMSDEQGEAISGIKQVRPKDRVEAILPDGSMTLLVEEIRTEEQRHG